MPKLTMFIRTITKGKDKLKIRFEGNENIFKLIMLKEGG